MDPPDDLEHYKQCASLVVPACREVQPSDLRCKAVLRCMYVLLLCELLSRGRPCRCRCRSRWLVANALETFVTCSLSLSLSYHVRRSQEKGVCSNSRVRAAALCEKRWGTGVWCARCRSCSRKPGVLAMFPCDLIWHDGAGRVWTLAHCWPQRHDQIALLVAHGPVTFGYYTRH